MDLSQDIQQKYSFHRTQQGCNGTEDPVTHTVKKTGRRILINNNVDSPPIPVKIFKLCFHKLDAVGPVPAMAGDHGSGRRSVRFKVLEEPSCGSDGTTFCVSALCCHRSCCMIISFRLLVIHFICLLTRFQLNFCENLWI